MCYKNTEAGYAKGVSFFVCFRRDCGVCAGRSFFSPDEIDELWSIWQSDKEDSYKFIIEILKTVSPEEDIADELMEILTDDSNYFSKCVESGIVLNINYVLQLGLLAVISSDKIDSSVKANIIQMIYDEYIYMREIPFFAVDKKKLLAN